VYVDVPWPVTPDFDICGIEDLLQLFFAEVVNDFTRMKLEGNGYPGTLIAFSILFPVRFPSDPNE
jgi:hypothetical protein